MTHLPPATAGGTLRERFIADMTVRGFTALSVETRTKRSHPAVAAVSAAG